MKKINKFLFLAILLSLVLSNCQKKEEKSTNTQNKKVENVSNQDVLREISLDEMLDFEHIPKNWKEEFREIAENMPSYGNNVVKISMYFYEKDFFYDYKKIFLDDNNNFVKPDEKQINDFLKMVSEKKFSDFDSVIQVLEKENKNDKLFGKLTGNWIESLKIWKSKADNLENYYQSGDYKKDNFAKGKTLNSEYLESIKQRKEKYRELNKIFIFKLKYLLKKTAVFYADQQYGNNTPISDLFKESLLIDIFCYKLYDWNEIYNAEETFEVPVEEKDREKYLQDLKKIQSEIKKVSDTMENKKYEFINSKTIINKEIYLLAKKENKANLELINQIMSDMENKKYTDINAIGILLMKRNQEIEQVIRKQLARSR